MGHLTFKLLENKSFLLIGYIDLVELFFFCLFVKTTIIYSTNIKHYMLVEMPPLLSHLERKFGIGLKLNFIPNMTTLKIKHKIIIIN